MNLKKIKKYFLFLTILVIVLTYLPIVNSYFQQDEWNDFAWHIFNLESGFFFAFKKSLFSFLAITETFNFLNYYIFGIQNYFPAIVVLMLVILNSLVWERNIFNLSKSRLISVGSLAFGYLSFLSSQSVTWVLPSISTQGSFLFINVSIKFLLDFIKYNKNKSLVLSIIAAILATYSKFNGFFIFPFIILYYFISNYKKIDRKFFSRILIGGFFLLVIASTIIFLQPKDFKIGAGRFVSTKKEVLFNALIIPVKTVSQIFISPETTYLFSADLLGLYYKKSLNQLEIYTIYTDYLSVLVGFSMIIIFIMTVNLKNKDRNLFYFLCLFYFLSLSPYFLDKFSTGTGFLESRYYYISVFPIGAMMFLWIKNFSIHILKNKNNNKKIINIFKEIFIFFIFIYLLNNVYKINNSIKTSNFGTKKREEILNFAKKELFHNINGDFIIFLDEVNHPNQKIKNITGTYFQTGFLYPFLVYSYESDNKIIDYYSFKDDTYWDMNFQGCRKIYKQEICLFYDYEELISELKIRGMDYFQIFSLKFDYVKLNNNQESTGHVDDLRFVEYSNNTNQIRERIKKDLQISNESKL